MALIVEDGSGVPDANSYGTLAGARAYASDRGVTLSATDADVIPLLINATDYLEDFDYVGQPVSYTQSLSWPRINVQFDPANPFPDDELPPQLVAACYQAVIEQFNGITLQPSVDYSAGGYVTEDKTDVLTTKYSERIGTTTQPLLPKVDSLLRTITVPTPALRTLRV